jgi:hypothetical protein
MKCPQAILIALFLMVSPGFALAQGPDKIKRPVKNPPQYPNIIDLENKEQKTQEQGAVEQEADALAQAMTSLANEVRTLVQEVRSLNLRQQAQLDILRMTRVDMRIDHYERELRPVRERIAALEVDEQNLLQLMTRDSLIAQTANIGTLDREKTIQQVKQNHEVRLRYVLGEKERMRKMESDLVASLGIYQNLSKEAERKIQAAEELLRQSEADRGERNRN